MIAADDESERTRTPTTSARDIVLLFVARSGVDVRADHLEQLAHDIDTYTAAQVGAYYRATAAVVPQAPPPDLRVRMPWAVPFLLGAVAASVAFFAVHVLSRL